MKKSIVIIGFGRFGQFWGSLLESKFDISFYDPFKNPDKSHGESVSIEQLKSFETIFWCTPISRMQESLRALANHLSPTAVVLDTASVKIKPCEWMSMQLQPSIQCIATHPLFGPDSFPARNTLAMHPLRCQQATFDYWVEHLTTLKMEIEIMSPDEHDKSISLTQGLCHFIGRSLACFDLASSQVDTLGYTRLQQLREQTCNDSKQLFLDMLTYNPYSKSMLNQIRDHQQSLYNEILEQEKKYGL